MVHDTLHVTLQGQILNVHSTEQYIVLVAAHGSVYILSFGCELIRRLEIGQKIHGENSAIVCNDGLIIVGDSSGGISTFSCEQESCQRNWRLKEDPITVITAVDATRVACGYSDGLIHIIDNTAGSMQQAYTSHTGSITTLIYSTPENKLISSSSEHDQIHIWDPLTGQCKHTISTPSQHILQISPNTLITGSRETPSIHIWNISNGTAIASLSPPASVRGTLGITPYHLVQSCILTTHRDGSIRIWSTNHAMQLYAFNTGKKAAYHLPAVPLNTHTHSGQDIHRILSGHPEGVVRLWRIPAPDSSPSNKEQEEGEDLPFPRGEKILKPKKSDTDRYALAYPLTVLDTPSGKAVAVVRAKWYTTPCPGEIDQVTYSTVFSVCRVEEGVW